MREVTCPAPAIEKLDDGWVQLNLHVLEAAHNRTTALIPEEFRYSMEAHYHQGVTNLARMALCHNEVHLDKALLEGVSVAINGIVTAVENATRYDGVHPDALLWLRFENEGRGVYVVRETHIRFRPSPKK